MRKSRRALVSTLVRSFGLTAPYPDHKAKSFPPLANAGIFRLRSVLVGTVAYQSYPLSSESKLPNALAARHRMSDICPFKNVSNRCRRQNSAHSRGNSKRV